MDGQARSLDVTTVVDLVSHSKADSNCHNYDVAIKGLLIDCEVHESKPFKVAPGTVIRCSLFVGAECIIVNDNCCDVKKISRDHGDMSFDEWFEKKEREGKIEERNIVVTLLPFHRRRRFTSTFRRTRTSSSRRSTTTRSRRSWRVWWTGARATRRSVMARKVSILYTP